MKVILQDTTVKKIIKILGHHKYNINSIQEIVETSILLGELKGALECVELMQEDAKNVDNSSADYMRKRIVEVVNEGCNG